MLMRRPLRLLALAGLALACSQSHPTVSHTPTPRPTPTATAPPTLSPPGALQLNPQTLAGGLQVPWALGFLPDGRIL
ncbi:MAG: PQQ-dependent sugar dehydrogenase, partial [Candidatus Dormibacteraeota bacterium]|nr:PQQ-dependent sugar dehydrogenase [Candidatus Dormibacteraeota bacterium]